ncbi:MAG TPA: hypothetical protein VGK38_13870, partial [Prolixibacteraceae bacterium]
QAFNDAFTQINKGKGCKGVGRYTVLACMGSMEVNSTFFEELKWKNRTFKFDSINGVMPENDDNFQIECEDKLLTIIKLNNYQRKFHEYISKNKIQIKDIAESIIQHCLLYFISNEAPTILIFNENEMEKGIVVNDLYKGVVKFDNEVKTIKVNGIKETFLLNYIRSFNTKTHSFHLCANKREVGKKSSISSFIPSFVHSLLDEESKKYFLSVYITSDFLDEKANFQRNKFSIPLKCDEKNSFDEICIEELLIALSNNVREQYSLNIITAEKEKNERIQNYIINPHKPRLAYRHLLTVSNVFDDIPANATDERLEAELHKKVFQLEQKRTKAFEKAFNKKKYDKEEFSNIIHCVLREEAAFSAGKLADLMVRRKAVIKLFRQYLKWRKDENYMLEEDLHNIIFTMGAESDIMPCEYHNLWLLDERLSFHSRTTSDRQMRTNKHIASDCQKETDLMIYDFPWAYTDNPSNINSLVIIEFKRPGRDMMQNSKDKNLDSQVKDYFEKLMESKAKSDKGEFLRIKTMTPKFGYVICELHDDLVEYNRLHNGFKPTPYNTLYKINPEINQYIEVMTYQTMLDFAEKRHDAFFKALGIDNL